MPYFSGDKLLGVQIGEIHAAPKHELGLNFTDQLGRTFRYVRADATGVAAGDAVKLMASDVVAACAVNDAVLGVAVVAITANQYGWVQTRGKVSSAKVVTGLTQYATVGRLAAASARLTPAVAVAEGGATTHPIGAQDVIGRALAAEAGNLADVYLY